MDVNPDNYELYVLVCDKCKARIILINNVGYTRAMCCGTLMRQDEEKTTDVRNRHHLKTWALQTMRNKNIKTQFTLRQYGGVF